MKGKPVVVIGVIYAIAVATFASGNILHNFFGAGDTKAENVFNSNVFEDDSVPVVPPSISSIVSEKSESKEESVENSTEISERPVGGTHSEEPIESVISTPQIAGSPYEKTTTVFERIPDGKDSRGYNVIYYLLDVKVKKIQDFRTNLVTDSKGMPGDNTNDTVFNQIKTVEKTLNVTVKGAISGDSAYSFTKRPGYVIRNSQLFRSSRRNGEDAQYEDLVLWRDGTMSTIMEKDYTAEELIEMKAWQTWMFGPTLVRDGEIAVTETDEIVSGKSDQGGNQRVAIGYLGPYHYLFFVSQGRTIGELDGFTLHDMAKILKDRGCLLAYNLDGGGSSTFYYLNDQGEQKKYPTQYRPRSLGDMIYVVDA